MTTGMRLWFMGSALMAAFVLVSASGAATTQGDDLPKTVKSIADAFKGGNADGAKKKAVAAAKKIEEVSDLMEVYSTLDISKNLKKPSAKNAQELGHLIAAMAELTLAKTPTKDAAKGRTKKAWSDMSVQLREAALELAAAKSDNAAVQAGVKLDNICTQCHTKFKD